MSSRTKLHVFWVIESHAMLASLSGCTLMIESTQASSKKDAIITTFCETKKKLLT